MLTRIYKNLHNNTFSVQQKNSAGRWQVVAHCTTLILKDCKFSVSESGRQKVLKEKRKNVHAFVIGDLICWCGSNYKDRYPRISGQVVRCVENIKTVSYNPYKGASFYIKSTGEQVKRADVVTASILDGYSGELFTQTEVK